MEQLIAYICLFWMGLVDKMLNPKYSRKKRILFFLIFYIPLAGVLIFFASLGFSRIGPLFSFLLYALALFLLIVLGAKVWLGSKAKETEAFEKVRGKLVYFTVRYKNRMLNAKNPLGTRILLFVLMILPFYLIPGVIVIFMKSMIPVISSLMAVTAVLTIVAAVVVFMPQKKNK